MQRKGATVTKVTAWLRRRRETLAEDAPQASASTARLLQQGLAALAQASMDTPAEDVLAFLDELYLMPVSAIDATSQVGLQVRHLAG